jgi:protein-disulfide isomerase
MSIEIGPGALVGALVLFAVLTVAGWWRLGGGSADAPSTTPPIAVSESTSTSAANAGVVGEDDPALGDARAPVTIIAYSDYRCPNCRQFGTEVLPWLKQTWLAQGFVRVVYRDFPIRGEASYAAAHAAHCAGQQGRYWEMHDRLFGELFSVDLAKPEIAADSLRRAAAGLGLDVDSFDACMAADRYRPAIEASDQSARAQGFEGTPTYLVNGRKTQGAIPIADWERLFRIYQQELGAVVPVPTPAGSPTAGAGIP